MSETIPIFTRAPVGLRRFSFEDRRDYFLDAALHLDIVGQRPHDTHLAGATSWYPLGDQLAGVDQQAGAHALTQPVLAQVPHLFTQLRQLGGRREIDPCLVLDDAGLDLAGRVGEIDRDEALPGAVL